MTEAVVYFGAVCFLIGAITGAAAVVWRKRR